jgi:hypothetical protein
LDRGDAAELVLHIPFISKASEVDLDISSEKIRISYQNKYSLFITKFPFKTFKYYYIFYLSRLAYERPFKAKVNPDTTTAKWDKKEKTLKITVKKA